MSEHSNAQVVSKNRRLDDGVAVLSPSTPGQTSIAQVGFVGFLTTAFLTTAFLTTGSVLILAGGMAVGDVLFFLSGTGGIVVTATGGPRLIAAMARGLAAGR